jgi:hypothetical protein
MKLSDDQIKEFRELYKLEHWVELSIEQATKRAYLVMNLYLCLQHKMSQSSSSSNQIDHGK